MFKDHSVSEQQITSQNLSRAHLTNIDLQLGKAVLFLHGSDTLMNIFGEREKLPLERQNHTMFTKEFSSGLTPFDRGNKRTIHLNFSDQ